MEGGVRRPRLNRRSKLRLCQRKWDGMVTGVCVIDVVGDIKVRARV